jgi:hypothetical protein
METGFSTPADLLYSILDFNLKARLKDRPANCQIFQGSGTDQKDPDPTQLGFRSPTWIRAHGINIFGTFQKKNKLVFQCGKPDQVFFDLPTLAFEFTSNF